MLRLSRNDLRDMALQLLADYYRTQTLPVCALDIEDFARNYMHLAIKYIALDSRYNHFLGCIAYEDTLIELDSDGPSRQISIARRTILLNDTLRGIRHRSRRNFTLAHECAHQAIYLLNPDAMSVSPCREAGRRYSLRDLSTPNDWWEWQANALASELLMPRHVIQALLERHYNAKRVRIYPGNWFLFEERRLLFEMKDFLGVSREALLIRLKQLDLLDYRSQEEYWMKEEEDSFLGGY